MKNLFRKMLLAALFAVSLIPITTAEAPGAVTV